MNANFPFADDFSYSKKNIYIVYVDDNFHYDSDEKYVRGEYDSVDEALIVCQEIVEDFLRSSYKPGMKSSELLRIYKTFGEDPYIPGHPFSAWSYAEKICEKLCRFDDFF